ncbi:MAG: hypothetical protein N2V77_00595 [Canidatus Methanoxibalbensis ujae]|nr:hypothetical protein [Candidatus Methanoxibalbensis ujae]
MNAGKERVRRRRMPGKQARHEASAGCMGISRDNSNKQGANKLSVQCYHYHT